MSIDDWVEPHSIEFTCGGCGRLIIGICMYTMHPKICGACLTSPGWVNNPVMVKAFDPFNDRVQSDITLTPEEVDCRSEWLRATLFFVGFKVKVQEDVVDWD